MADTLLSTKLYIPHPRQELVPRPRLLERLEAGLRRKLTLVSAPAGFGKSTLLSSWIHQEEIPAGWVSLDEGDNDPVRFLTYLIAGLQAAVQALGTSVGDTPMAMLHSPQPPAIESILTVLINEIAEIPQDLLLVLDDYHLVEAKPIHDALAFLLDHLPPQMHLVLITRSDPFLPLSRLRARGQMVDIRADDLRFTTQEAATFLNQEMGLGLSPVQVAALGTRTEGWIAGLQLAAYSMQSYKQENDAAGFIAAFAGDDRYIADYLVDEVLAQQPKDTQNFLLQTSILDRMTGSLCDAVTGQQGGTQVLQALERVNLFIVSLDNRRNWYRYHHLFADLLRQRLEESRSPQEIASLHRRASQWYEENDFLVQAVEHGLAAQEYEQVIRLILENAQELLIVRSQQNILLGWWAHLPQESVASQLELCMTYAWAWVATGHPKEAECCLQMVEQTLGAGLDVLIPEGEAERVDPAIQGALVEIAVVRAQLAIGRGDIPEALNLTGLAVPYLKDDEGPHLLNPPANSRLIVFFIMGMAHKLSSELDAADKALSAAAILGQERGNVHIVAAAYGHLVSVQVMQSHLRRAEETCQQGLRVVQEMAGHHSPLLGLLQVELGNLLYERNDLEAALHHLQEGISLAKPWRYLDALLPGYTGLARQRAARGDWEGAYTALDELAAFGTDNPQAVMPAVHAFRAMLWAAQGKLDVARRWVQSAGLDLEGEIDLFRESELVALSRVLMAEQQWEDAARLIDRLTDAMHAGERWGRLIELLALWALVLDAQGKPDQALEPLARALRLAEPEGYVRTFVDQGEPMAALLRRAVSQGTPAMRQLEGYVAGLLAAFGPDATLKNPPSATALVEPLSERELEVLLLLKTPLSGPEIARQLSIALPTLRFHTRNIYGKLGVHNRMQAVSQAETLGLL